jgi:hypothetical protein
VTLRARWARDKNDRDPADGEAIGWLEAADGWSETIEAGGGVAPSLVIGQDGVAPGLEQTSDLHIRHVMLKMYVRAGDGREIVAKFGMDVDAPQIDADARADLRDAVVRLWRARLPVGRPPGLTTIPDDESLREPIREMQADKRRITIPKLAAWSGFTEAEIRGYLRVTGRELADFLFL